VSLGVSYLDDQVVRYDWKYLLSEKVLPDRMASWRESVLAAEAKKAGNGNPLLHPPPAQLHAVHRGTSFPVAGTWVSETIPPNQNLPLHP